MRKRMTLLLAVLGLLLLGGVVVAIELPELLPRWVIASGGGTVTSASYRLNSTIGQAVIGDTSSPAYRLRSGYWPGMGAGPGPGATPTKTLTPVPGLTQRLTIPIIIKNFWSP